MSKIRDQLTWQDCLFATALSIPSGYAWAVPYYVVMGVLFIVKYEYAYEPFAFKIGGIKINGKYYFRPAAIVIYRKAIKVDKFQAYEGLSILYQYWGMQSKSKFWKDKWQEIGKKMHFFY